MGISNQAVVLSCKGGNQGDLGLVRSLGRQGINVVFVTEDHAAHALSSRYVKSSILIESFKTGIDELITKLVRYAEEQEVKPVLFPTADPDLEFVSKYRSRLEKYFFFTFPSAEIVDVFLDKEKFFHFGIEKGYPLAKTIVPDPSQDIRNYVADLDYPIILKPISPIAWNNREIQTLVASKKAVLVGSPQELVRIYESIARYNSDMLIQEYIPGRDDRLHSVHVYMGRDGRSLVSFVGRKVRTYPAYAGIGCFVISEYNQHLVDLSIDILSKAHYTGIALLQFKRDTNTEKFVLLEINARASSWNQLASYCGINIPYWAYLDVLQQPLPIESPQVNGVKYVYFKADLLALKEYRSQGDWTIRTWIGSYMGKKTYQLFCLDDPLPFLKVFINDVYRSVCKGVKKLASPLRSKAN